LQPALVEAALVPPSGTGVNAILEATVIDPRGRVYATFELSERVGDIYRSQEELQLPLDALAGYWWLIVHVESDVPRAGSPVVTFEVDPVAYHDLGDVLRPGVSLQVPVDFDEVLALGNAQAGARVWAMEGTEVGLWWAPGPAEPLTLSTAVTMLEATHAAIAESPSQSAIQDVFEMAWEGQPAYEFTEMWSEPDGGPAWAWVIQASDRWLVVLRVRSRGRDEIPRLLEEIAGTLHLVAP
jgi:hypothetical protein